MSSNKRILALLILLGAAALILPLGGAAQDLPAPFAAAKKVAEKLAEPEKTPAAGKPAGGAAADGQKKGDEGKGSSTKGGLHEVKVWADRMIYDDKKKLLRLIGNVRVREKDTTLYAPYVEFNTETEIGDITGGVRVEQPDTVLTSDRMKVFYKEKRAQFAGNVKASTTRQPSKIKSERAKEEMTGARTTLTCREMEFWWEKKEGIAKGNVKVEQRDKRAFADEGLYSEQTDLITLRGNVRLERGRNDWMNCHEAQVDMKEETFTAIGNVEGAFIVREGKKEKAREGKMNTPTPSPRIPEKKVKKLPKPL
jgi:lipopolysaccharide assembly outer membrane protein LptD (OstA)